MKLHLVSDLHFEFGNKYSPNLEADVLILAGDICPDPNRIIDYCLTYSNLYKHLILVLGNHDYYHNDIDEVNTKLKDAFSGTNIHFLNNESITIDGIKFFGGTCWSDYAIGTKDVVQYINDFKLIQNFDLKRFKTLHEEFRKELLNNLDSNVIITHFSPSIRLLDSYFYGCSFNYYFHCNDLENTFTNKFKWLFGHTHKAIHRTIDNSIFYSNPLGYPMDKNTGFNENLIIEV